MYLAAAVITDPAAVIDHKLYWAAMASLDEAQYLCTVLNSQRLTLAVREYQARGEHNPRDFDKYVWQLPIPLFNKADPLHSAIARLGKQAEPWAASLDLPATRFEKQRGFVRAQMVATTTVSGSRRIHAAS